MNPCRAHVDWYIAWRPRHDVALSLRRHVWILDLTSTTLTTSQSSMPYISPCHSLRATLTQHPSTPTAVHSSCTVPESLKYRPLQVPLYSDRIASGQTLYSMNAVNLSDFEQSERFPKHLKRTFFKWCNLSHCPLLEFPWYTFYHCVYRDSLSPRGIRLRVHWRSGKAFSTSSSGISPYSNRRSFNLSIPTFYQAPEADSPMWSSLTISTSQTQPTRLTASSQCTGLLELTPESVQYSCRFFTCVKS